jgi:ABC-type phosphate/phosphonate transport system substrate-binding protein
MSRPGSIAIGLILLAAVLPGLATPAAENEAAPAAAVRIGLISTLFRDTPAPVVQALMEPFGTLMESQTGVSGRLIAGGDAETLGRQLKEDRLQLAVFHGIEFAWAQQKFPDLRPLVLAVNRHRILHAHLLVRDDQGAANLAALKGKVLALPRRSREHCRVFLDRCCQDLGQEPKDFFGKITTPPNLEEALDELVRGNVDATVVDGVALECYQEEKPACFARLKTLKKSEPFPPAVLAYRPGALDEATLTRFRTGLLNAHQNTRGRQLLSLWKLTSFERVPNDFAALVAAVAKAYPAQPSTGK